ncbi:coiled-coil domain-containing protein 88B isoform X3 [Hyperolius riggenbachi]|uniref:coiled-coil domain-containing protein 88B isoform X3 n=1 Tax=Hyperolius riggenbachi TaxID=752182 RepID=UPI0035A34DEA
MNNCSWGTVEELMDGALVTWIQSFEQNRALEYGPLSPIKDPVKEYMKLTGGGTLHYVMSFIDTRPYHGNVDLPSLKWRLRSYYQDELQQMILMTLPDTHLIAQDPISVISFQEMEKLISLMLGAAVQGEGREEIIGGIQSLNFDFQTKLAEKIQEVTQNPQNIFTLPESELSNISHSDLEDLVHILHTHLKHILRQRDDAFEQLSIIRCEQHTRSSNATFQGVSQTDPNAWQNNSLYIADLQSKLRRVRQELEEKSEELLDSQQQVQILEMDLRKVHQQVRELSQMAALSRSYRDELDALRERVRRSEAQVSTLTEKLRAMDLYQRSLQEEKEFSRSLLVDKEVLEHQLAAERERSETLRMCEREKQSLEERLKSVVMEKEADCQQMQYLLEDNLTLTEEIRILRDEASQGWKKPYETDTGACSMWEREHLTIKKQEWDKRNAETEDLGSELSQVLLRLEEENHILRERMQTLMRGSVEMESLKQYHTEKKYKAQVLDYTCAICIREEPEGGSLMDKRTGGEHDECKGTETNANLESNTGQTLTRETHKDFGFDVQPIQKELEESYFVYLGAKEILSLKAQLELCTASLEKIQQEKNSEEAQSLKNQLKVSTVAVQELLSQLNWVNEDSQALNMHLLSNAEQVKKLNADLELKSKEIQFVKTQLELSTKELMCSKKELELRYSEILSLKSQLELSTGDVSSMKQQQEMKTAEVHSLKAQLEFSAVELHSLKAQSEINTQELQLLKTQLESSAKDVHSLQTHLKLSIQEIHSLKAKLELSSDEVHSLTIKRKLGADEMQSLKKQLQEKEVESASHQKQIQVKSLDIKCLKKQLKETEESHSTKQQKQESSGEMLSLKQQLEVLENVDIQDKVRNSREMQSIRQYIEEGEEQSAEEQCEKSASETVFLRKHLDVRAVDVHTSKSNLEQKEEFEQLLKKPLKEKSDEMQLLKRNLESRDELHQLIQKQLEDGTEVHSLKKSLDEREKIEHMLKRQLEEKDKEVHILKRSLEKREQLESLLERQLEEKTGEAQLLKKSLESREEIEALLKRQLEERTTEVQEFKESLTTEEAKVQLTQRQLEDQITDLRKFNQDLIKSEGHEQTIKRDAEEQTSKVQELKRNLEKAEGIEQLVKRQLEESAVTIQFLRRQLQGSSSFEQLLKRQLEENERLKQSQHGMHEQSSEKINSLQKQLQEKDVVVQSLKRQLIDMEENSLLQQLKEHVVENDVLNSLTSESASLKQQLQDMAEKNESLTYQIFIDAKKEHSFLKKMKDNEADIQSLNAELQDREENMLSLKKKLNESSGKQKTFERKLEESDWELQLLKRHLEENEGWRKVQLKQLEEDAKERQACNKKLQENAEEIQTLKRQMKDKEAFEIILNKKIQEKSDEIECLNKIIQKSFEETETLKKHLSERNGENFLLQRRLEEREQILKRQLEENSAELQFHKCQLKEFTEQEKAWKIQTEEGEREKLLLQMQLDEKNAQLLERHLNDSAQIQALKKQMEDMSRKNEVLTEQIHKQKLLNKEQYQKLQQKDEEECLARQLQLSTEEAAAFQRLSSAKEGDIKTLKKRMGECTESEQFLKEKPTEVSQKPLKVKLCESDESAELLQEQLYESFEDVQSTKHELAHRSKVERFHKKKMGEEAESFEHVTEPQKKLEEESRRRMHLQERQLFESGHGENTNEGLEEKCKSMVTSLDSSSKATYSVSDTPFSLLFSKSAPTASPISVAALPGSISATTGSHVCSASVTASPQYSAPASYISVSQVKSTSEPIPTLCNAANDESPLSLLLLELNGVRRERSELQGRYDSLIRDLQRQEGELERLQRELRKGRSVMRLLKQEHRELQDRSSQLSIQKEEAQQEHQRKLQEQMDKVQELKNENQKLQEEQTRLQEELSRLEKISSEKASQLRDKKRELGAVQSEREHLDRKQLEMKETIRRMEISNTSLSEQCQVLSQVKLSLQDQNNILLSQINSLTHDNRKLLERSLESGALRQEEERHYREKLTELKHEKQKLLDKIMDQYRVLEPVPALQSHRKGNWIADKMKRLLKTKDKPSKGPGEAPRFLSPPKEPVLEPESSLKSEVTLHRSRSSVSISSQSIQITPPQFHFAKLSSTIRTSESFSEADSTPREKFRLRRRAQVIDNEVEDVVSEEWRERKPRVTEKAKATTTNDA